MAGAIAVAPPVPAGAAPSPHQEIVALRIDGVGSGHGRGMSQWGAYGRAINGGQSWQQILNAYYGGTVSGTATNESRRVRLVGADGRTRLGVVSDAVNLTPLAGNSPIGGPFRSIEIVQRSGGSFQVYGLSAASCGPANSGWTDLGVHSGPVAVRSSVNTTTAAPGSVPGLCSATGSVTHYRGQIEVLSTQWGVRVINVVPVEDYLRGVVPREVSASWGGSGGTGPGMHTLRAQAVAARSYALSQNRYPYAQTCDTTACQAYGGSARRSSATAPVEVREHSNTDRAIAETARVVRRWPADNRLVSTEYSASNGPRTAGGAFPAIDDPFDDVRSNPNHRWTRIISADRISAVYGVSSLSAARTERDPEQARRGFEGIWANRVVLEGSRTTVVDAWTFRGNFGLPSPGFTVTPITRDRVYGEGFALIGDSTGVGITSGSSAPLPPLLNGVFAANGFDALECRRTVRTNCGSQPDNNGIAAAGRISGSPAVAVVMLGYNDDVLDQQQIDAMVQALLARGVGRVAWVNLSERSSSSGARYARSNAALDTAASRWRELDVIDWRSASAGANANRWFASDGVHLTTTGNAEFAHFLRNQVFGLVEGGLGPGKVNPSRPLELALDAERPAGATGVALNVTVLDPEGDGFATVWPCDTPRKPNTSNINFVASPPTGNPTVAPNAVMVGLGPSSKICVSVSVRAHVFVDLAGWLSSGFEPLLEPTRIVDTRHGFGAARGPMPARAAFEFVVGGAPAGASSVVMNVTAVGARTPGYLTVWPCAESRPNASNVNYSAGGGAAPNLVIAQLAEDRRICVYTQESVEVLVDVMGYLRGGFTPIVPERRVDTRTGVGGPNSRIAPQRPLEVPSGGATVPSGAVAVAMNVTAVAPNAPGYLTVWPCSVGRPNASNVNYPNPGDLVAEPNLVVASLQPDGRVCVHAEGPTFVLVDIAGYFTSGFTPVVPKRLIDTRSEPH